MPEELKRLVDELTDEVEGLRVEVHEQNLRRRRERRTVWLTIGAIVLAGVLALGGAYYLIQKNNSKFCSVVAATTDPSYPPPTTDRGRVQLRNFEQLGRDLGCNE